MRARYGPKVMPMFVLASSTLYDECLQGTRYGAISKGQYVGIRKFKTNVLELPVIMAMQELQSEVNSAHLRLIWQGNRMDRADSTLNMTCSLANSGIMHAVYRNSFATVNAVSCRRTLVMNTACLK